MGWDRSGSRGFCRASGGVQGVVGVHGFQFHKKARMKKPQGDEGACAPHPDHGRDLSTSFDARLLYVVGLRRVSPHTCLHPLILSYLLVCTHSGGCPGFQAGFTPAVEQAYSGLIPPFDVCGFLQASCRFHISGIVMQVSHLVV